MKRLFTLCLMLFCALHVMAQDCYNSTRQQGIGFYNNGNYSKAKNYFVEAKNCPDAPMGHDLDSWISKCNEAIQRAQAQADAAEIARKGYMNITSIRFCNEDDDNNVIDAYGSTLYAGSICYLKPAIFYTGLSDRERQITLHVKIFEDGILSQSSSSPDGYTYTKEVTVKPGANNNFVLPGWGNASPGSYGQTSVVRLEVYYQGRKLKSQEITLQPGIKPGGNSGGGNAGGGNAGAGSAAFESATSVDRGNSDNTGASYLRVDNKTEVNSSWGHACSSETYYVSTDGSDYKVWLLPSWCKLTSKTSTSFTIMWDTNTGCSRSDWFEVTSNNIDVRVNVRQAHAPGATDATYLRVDNKTEVQSNWSGSAGSETYYVSTDGSDYRVYLLPSWCEVTNKTATSFTITWEANTTGSSRSDWFRVESADQRVRVNVTQASGGSSNSGGSGSSQESNALSRKEWATLMRKAVDYVGVNYDNGAYKGQRDSNGVRQGLGVYWWSEDGDYFWGRWENGDQDGMGIYMMGDDSYNINNCQGCRYFVGQYDNDSKSGKGTCYDSWGNLIYYGDFSNDSPTGSYPNGENYSQYKFEVIKYTDGAMYVGETKNGERHGYGIYLWSSGAAWYGPWEDGQRDGYGIYLPYQGSSQTGTWRGDTKVN